MATRTNHPDDEQPTNTTEGSQDKEPAQSPAPQDKNRVQQGSDPAATDEEQDPSKKKSEAEVHAEREQNMTEEEKSRHQYQTTRLPGEVTVSHAVVAGLHEPQDPHIIETSGKRKINFDVPTGARPEEVAQDYPRPSGNVGKDIVSGQTGRDVISDRLAMADGARNRQFQQDQQIQERAAAQAQARQANQDQNRVDVSRRQSIPVPGEPGTERLPREGREVRDNREGTSRTAAKDVSTPPVKDSSTKK